MSSPETNVAAPREVFLWSLRAVLSFVVIMAGLLLLAGRIDYWQGWLYTGLSIAVLAATFIALRRRADLIRERLKPGKGMKWWDMVWLIVSTVMLVASIVLAGLDAGRFHWGPAVPVWAVTLGAAVYVFGQAIFTWAKRENRFLSSVVRLQKDRGQTVCTTGPYRFVRHPSYLAGILFSLAMPVILGSLIAVIPQAVAAVALVVRTALEDALLRRELEGYADYAKRTKYRLLPGVW